MTKANRSYQDLKHELEEVLEKLQQDEIDIDEAIKLHTKGEEILKQLEAYLDGVSKNIKNK